MIELRDVTIRAGSFRLENISFQIEAGQYAVLMGRTGLGKTTILEAISGLRQVSKGQIFIRSVDVTRWNPADRQLGYVPQDLALFPSMSVREHLEFGPKLRRFAHEEANRCVSKTAEVLGISHLMERSIAGLSGGEAQRVALGRALSSGPSVLLLDEPLSALDEETRTEMHSWLRSVKENTGVTTLHVTHNEEEAAALADVRLRLEVGGVFLDR
jgi:ABC-type sugar transport system ATPase subunit